MEKITIITKNDARALAGAHARPSHYDQDKVFANRDVELSDAYGAPFARLIPEILNGDDTYKLLKRATSEMWKVNTPLTNRGNVAGKGSLMKRKRQDGTFGDTHVIPPSVRELLGCGDVIGYLAPSVRTPRYRLSGYTKSHPAALIAVLPLASAISDIFYNEYPIEHDHQAETLVDCFHPMAFSSLNVNVEVRSGYHPDDSNQEGSWSALFTDGEYEGGGLVLPGRRVCLNISPGGLLFFKGGEDIHGVLPYTGSRLSGVWFAAGKTNLWEDVELPEPDPNDKSDL